jgi:hypothetical protein
MIELLHKPNRPNCVSHQEKNMNQCPYSRHRQHNHEQTMSQVTSTTVSKKTSRRTFLHGLGVAAAAAIVAGCAPKSPTTSSSGKEQPVVAIGKADS